MNYRINVRILVYINNMFDKKKKRIINLTTGDSSCGNQAHKSLHVILHLFTFIYCLYDKIWNEISD